MLGSLQLDRKSLAQLIDVNLAVSGVPNNAHKSSLKRLNLATLREEPLQVIVDASLLDPELLIFVLRALQLLIELRDLPVRKLKLFFSAFDVL